MSSLFETHPHLIIEWHPGLNLLKPEDLSQGSTKKVWWKCNLGHEWEARIDHRTRGSGCPYCSNQKVLIGYNDLRTTHPKLSIELDDSQYSSIDFTSGSNKKVQWKCSQGHLWQQSIIKRAQRSDGCPYCSGRKAIPGVNDLVTSHPDIALQWHPHSNGSASPNEFKSGSVKEVWWSCSQGHEWSRSIHNHVRTNGQCPYCTGRELISGTNDLQALNPDLYAQLVVKEMLYPHSGKKVAWRCDDNHEWTTSVNSRTKGASCPICSGRTALKGKTDLASINPTLALEFHPSLNLSLNSALRPSSRKKVWWLCSEGHEWEAWVYARTAGSGCPSCATSGPSKMESELAHWVESLGVKVVRNTRSIITPYELDIYLPDYNFAIEFNGLYWHSEAAGKTKDYHLKKTKAAQAIGINLLQVWEDDWREHPGIIKRMILHRLGLSKEQTVYARRTQVISLTTAQAHEFLELNHIQGKSNGSLYLGLKSHADNILVAVMVMKNFLSGQVYLERYATAHRVPGGFTKLLKAAIKEMMPTQIITFADCSISDGHLYEKAGFVVDKVLLPDYSYLVRGNRIHKFNYRLKRFRDDPDLQHREGLTESELAQLNRIPRVWDSGKIRYTLNLEM